MALQTLLVHHLLLLLVLCHLLVLVLVLVQNVWVCSGLQVGTWAGVEVSRTVADAQLAVLQRKMVLLALYYTPYVVGPPDTVVEVSVRIAVGAHKVLLQNLPTA